MKHLQMAPWLDKAWDSTGGALRKPREAPSGWNTTSGDHGSVEIKSDWWHGRRRGRQQGGEGGWFAIWDEVEDKEQLVEVVRRLRTLANGACWSGGIPGRRQGFYDVAEKSRSRRCVARQY